ncbi:YheC/YheD family protein [Metabacillus iocasae]|uniref:Glutathione synthase/RimK-type ligase-like ATP-grasp enzyme n=1 Tax=Priestia iocasae TaxID=2291674 RepID=A0ABS2QTA7_9BACI|nr:YheC/YheD family protein [Metabacillus iocasae]MBM7702701.1 glutathione synthase/RimK-type ligase-like ATP-grasp enzyme [Metabacillus iocasae]
MNLLNIKMEPLATSKPSLHVRLSSNLATEYMASSYITLRCSNHSIQTITTLVTHKENIMYCSKGVYDALHLPYKPLHLLAAIVEDEVSLGPIIGIVTETSPNSDATFGSITSFCRELLQTCEEKGAFAAIYSISDLLAEDVKGYIACDEGWEYVSTPLPQIVHNRIHSRKTENHHSFQEMTQVLAEKRIPFFNAHYLNKWFVFEKLKAIEHLKPYLPDTVLLRKKQDFIDALAMYPSIFIKPIHGSQGKHIFKVSKDEHNYLLDYTTFTQPYSNEYETFYDLFEALYGQLKKQGFIIQQTIPLQTYKDCPFDFRLLCHKKNDLQWKLTSMVARVSQPNYFVSNLARGGDLYSPKVILESMYEKKHAKSILVLLKELAIDICHHLDAATAESELYAEFGIDLAIDQDGKPWIIEVNTKPSKQFQPEHVTTRPSTKALIDYCLYSFHSNGL